MIGIIAAMPVEAKILKEQMSDVRSEKVGYFDFLCGKIAQKDVVVVVGGVGKVFAGAVTQAMIIKYSPDAIINIGVAGTLTRELSIGDVIVADRTVQHDMDTSAVGDPVGMISGINMIYLPTSESLSSLIVGCCREEGKKAILGTIASGDKFVCEADEKKRIVDLFAAKACEMEGAAIAQVCFINNVECAVVRTISDSLEGSYAFDYDVFRNEAADNSCRVIVKAIEKM